MTIATSSYIHPQSYSYLCSPFPKYIPAPHKVLPSHARKLYAKRSALFMKLDEQLNKLAAYGSGLRNKSSIKRTLGISTKRYLHTGEIAGYANKVSGVAKAANLIKKGAYVGIVLDVAATGLEIHKACEGFLLNCNAISGEKIMATCRTSGEISSSFKYLVYPAHPKNLRAQKPH